MNNITAARAIFQRGVWERPSHPRTVELWTSWALLEERCGDYQAAREYLRAALRAERFSVWARATWAAMEARLGDFAASRQLFEDALRIDPSNRGVWSAYESMERAARRPQAADQIATRALGSMSQAGALGTKVSLKGDGLPSGLEAAERAAAARLGNRKSLESTLLEQYGSTQT
eukprot:scaffold227240_cov32-Tisochrysis_lutea.AAC.1